MAHVLKHECSLMIYQQIAGVSIAFAADGTSGKSPSNRPLPPGLSGPHGPPALDKEAPGRLHHVSGSPTQAASLRGSQFET